MSANNVVWVMKYKQSYHVFYSGCMDNTPTEPDYKDKYYKEFKFRPNALLHAHNVVNKINELSLQEGFTYVEYGVCEITITEEFNKLNFEKRLSNIDDHINTLTKESIETNIIVKKTLDSWLEKNGERIVKEYVREFKPSLSMEIKFKENEGKIKKLEDKVGKDKIECGLSLWEVVENLSKGLIMKHPSAKNAHCSIDVCFDWIYKQLQDWKKELLNG